MATMYAPPSEGFQVFSVDKSGKTIPYVDNTPAQAFLVEDFSGDVEEDEEELSGRLLEVV